MDTKDISTNRIIGKLLYLHLIVVFAQFGIRWYADLTIVRDFFIFIILWVAISSSVGYKKNRLTKTVLLFLVYGFLMLLVHSISSSGFITALTEFRNYFFPFVLVFPLSVYFLKSGNRLKLVNFLYVLLIILIVDVYIEGAMEMLGITRSILPWYQFQYLHSERFVTSTNPIERAIYPEDSPVLGLLGWPNATACTLTALYAFISPFLFTGGIRDASKLGKKSSAFKTFLVVCVVGALAILQIKTPMFAFLMVTIVLLFKSNRKAALSLIIAIVVVSTVAFATRSLWMDAFSFLMEESTGDEGAISYVFSLVTLRAVLSSFMGSSILTILFGGDFSGIGYYENIEIRLLTFTMQLGLIWLIFFLGICYRLLNTTWKLNKSRIVSIEDKRINMGVLLMMVVYLIDMLHYSYLMYLFNINIFAVMIALAVGLNYTYKHYGKVS